MTATETTARADAHKHGPQCRRDSEGPSIWWLCGYEPMFTERELEELNHAIQGVAPNFRTPELASALRKIRAVYVRTPQDDD